MNDRSSTVRQIATFMTDHKFKGEVQRNRRSRNVFFLEFIYRQEEFTLNSGIFSTLFSSVTQQCLTLCDPMNRSMPGLPVHHQLPKVTQIHVHRVSFAIQPSHPLSSPSPPMSQLFAGGGQSTGVSASASVLPVNTED